MNGLTVRVAAVREELAKLLADDDDMTDMCLTRKEALEAEEAARHGTHAPPSRSPRPRSDGDGDGDGDGTDEKNLSMTWTTNASFDQRDCDADGASASIGGGGGGGDEPRSDATPASASAPRRRRERRRGRDRSSRSPSSSSSASSLSSSSSSSSSSKSSTRSSDPDDEAHEGVEALLEAYYMHVDYSHKRLCELRDAIEDTEDLAEISLDSQRNQLIRIDLLLSNGMLAVGMFSMVAGVFGMNLRTGWESDQQAFRDVCFVSGAASVLVFASVVMYLRAKKLLSM